MLLFTVFALVVLETVFLAVLFFLAVVAFVFLAVLVLFAVVFLFVVFVFFVVLVAFLPAHFAGVILVKKVPNYTLAANQYKKNL